jgi:glycosyltransferase involved in cell wall biosynthesis
MKILFINTWMHHKNMQSLLLYNSIELEIVNKISDIDKYDLTTFDCVYSPSDPIDVSKFPETSFVFGPHFSTFPTEKLLTIKSKKSSYIVLSDWVKNLWQAFDICDTLKLVDIPFAVDTKKFCEIKPIQQRNLVFIYYKSRQPQELECIENLLKHNNIQYRIFHYHHRYNESEYLEYLQNAKFGIWVDAHESQGFALEEALSCNVPLLVWNITSMNQEYGQHHSDIQATTIPYWDDKCGEYFYNMTDFQEKSRKFFNNLDSYRPREYILENLSPSICEKKFIDMVLELKNN